MIKGTTKLVGIIGSPVGHSLSPRMQNAAFRARGLDWCYIPLNLEPRFIKRGVEALSVLGFEGFNVTIPHKQTIIPLLDRITPEARFIGAVNTVVIKKGKLMGHNTDAEGFLRALREGRRLTLRGKKVLVLGAGGAARAVSFRLSLEGVREITIANRSAARSRALVADLKKAISRKAASSCRFSSIPLSKPHLAKTIPGVEIVVNATSMGMGSNPPLLLPPGTLSPKHIVCDLVYQPPDTGLLKQAVRSGARPVNGLGMLLYQGALAFEIWTGKKAPIKAMRAVLQKNIR